MTTEELKDINSALEQIKIVGDRYPEEDKVRELQPNMLELAKLDHVGIKEQ